MRHRLGEGQHGLDAGIQRGEHLAPLGEVALLDLDLDLALERTLVVRLGRKPACRQLGTTDGGAELLHELWLQAADREPAAVARAVVVIETATVERLILHVRLHTGAQVACARHAMQAEGTIGHAHVDLLALAAHLALHHGGKQADHPMQRAAGQVRQLYPQRQRAAVSTPGIAGDAGQCEVVDVVPGAITIRPALAITGDRHVDQPRVDRLERLVADAQLVHHTGAKLLQHDVVFTHQLLDHLDRLRALEVEGDAALVAVQVGVAGGGAAIVWRQYAHQVHARRRLDAQNVCAHVGEQQGSEWPWQQGGEVENLQRRQWAAHGVS